MRYVEIGGDRVSAIGLGAWQFGAKEWDWQPSLRDQAIRIIHRAIELGVNLIDTAELYGRGESESIVGEAIDGRRDDVFLASKVFPSLPLPKRIQRAAAASLERLRTDRMDLYQIHFPNPVIPLGVQMKGMRAVRDAGQTKHIGVSNFTLRRWRKAEAALGAPVMTNQVSYSLLRRKPDCLLPWASANKRVVIAYSPLAQGLLSGKYGAQNAPGDVRSFNMLFTRTNMEAARPVLTAVHEVAKAHGATSAQIALAWLLHHPQIVAIPGARTLSQMEENAAAADIRLSEDQYQRLTAAADGFHRAGLRAAPQLVGRVLRANKRR